jgi:hypothetical protein
LAVVDLLLHLLAVVVSAATSSTKEEDVEDG